jgi:DNA polymerase theta
VLLGADYRQLELRLMAHFSGDTNLLAALGSQESDPFVNLAANWLNLPVHEVCG